MWFTIEVEGPPVQLSSTAPSPPTERTVLNPPQNPSLRRDSNGGRLNQLFSQSYMADTRSQEQEMEGECALPSKRKRALAAVTAEDGGGELPSKAPKNGAIDGVGDSENAKTTSGGDNENGQGKNRVPEASATVESGVDEDEEDEEYGDDSESDEEDDEEEEDYEERSVDLKGKGILKDDKGKGKLIFEDEDDSDDSDDADLNNDGAEAGSESDSDLSDDPLTEVDLDNILPSRTRRSRAQPGVSIAGDRRNSGDGGNSNA